MAVCEVVFDCVVVVYLIKQQEQNELERQWIAATTPFLT